MIIPPDKFWVNNYINISQSKHIFRMRNDYAFGPLNTCDKDTDLTLFLVVLYVAF